MWAFGILMALKMATCTCEKDSGMGDLASLGNNKPKVNITYKI